MSPITCMHDTVPLNKSKPRSNHLQLKIFTVKHIKVKKTKVKKKSYAQYQSTILLMVLVILFLLLLPQ